MWHSSIRRVRYILSDYSANVEWSSQLYDGKNQRQSIITVSYVLMHLKGQEARDLLVVGVEQHPLDHSKAPFNPMRVRSGILMRSVGPISLLLYPWSQIRNLWNRLEDGGVLVVIEAGTPTGFRFIHHIRELFIMQLP